MSEVGQFLDTLQGEGELESQGSFSVDLSKAREKLEQFRLVSPHHYVLALLSAAVSAGAESFVAEMNHSFHSFSFEGKAYKAQELKGMFESMLAGGGSPEPRLNDLGVAIQGTRGLELKGFHLTSGSHTECIQVTMDDQVVTIQTLDEEKCRRHTPQPSTLFKANLQSTKMQRFGALIFGLETDPEAAKILKRYGRYAPLDVQLNGKSINNKRLGPWTLGAKIVGHTKIPEFLLAGERKFQFDSSGDFAGYIGFGAGNGGWMLVHNGLAFQFSTELSAYPTSRAVIYANHLKKDISGQGLVRNEDFETLCRDVDKLLGKTLRTATSGPANPQIKEFVAEVKASKRK